MTSSKHHSLLAALYELANMLFSILPSTACAHTQSDVRILNGCMQHLFASIRIQKLFFKSVNAVKYRLARFYGPSCSSVKESDWKRQS